jgi:2-dehydro-3-deoxygluconokinase
MINPYWKANKFLKMVVCFGELLLRLSPDANDEWIKKNALDVYLGGSEFNVAAALAKWKTPVCYSTVLPENFLTTSIINQINRQNIDTTGILFSGEKMGLYYLTKGAEIQHTEIIYDRQYSAFSKLQPGTIDWDKALNGVRWFHFSAITPALCENIALVCKEAVEACAKKNITVSVDLNYRAKLWQYGKKAEEVMPELLPYCDVVMGNIWSAETMLKIKLPASINADHTKEYLTEQAKKTSEKIIELYPKCKVVANTFRFSESYIEYFGTLFTNSNMYVSATYKAEAVKDRVGSGDCFMAGLIYGIFNHLPYQQVINFATGAAFQKLFIAGDTTDKTAEEVRSFIQHYSQ